ncbi:uncharacterized protein LOC144669012 isoform X1 [Cetorhinus maximus]
MLWYGTVLLIQSVEDSLPWVPVLTDMKRQAETTFRTTSPRNNRITGNSKYSPHDTPGLLYNREGYINVAKSVSNVNVPGLSQLEVVLTKYCVDCRLDWHWEQCLQEILSESPLPPNPYPTVASEFIKASLRMDLWQKRDEEIIRQTLQLTSKLIDCEHYIFQVPGLEVFGLKSALCPLNPNTFQTVLGLVTLIRNKDIPHRYQDFKVLQSSAGSSWQYLPIIKYFVLYYFEDQEESWLCFPQHDPIAVYQDVFLSKEAAVFHCQRVGPAGDPFNGANQQKAMTSLDPRILESFSKKDLLTTYRSI